ncbi:glycosyltransferase family 2 protein [Pseudoalteromonas rubra]|uniref:glycosyltransferase family 2 protein n=1 Tax=Pseudoalteromonas rubra TaxID=43658 RepID=UPI002DB922BE|nr:glycosyltransferase family 2 protein [Pseudoalteromonas rubra]MEC4089915.1 glycosyltransferase family 2 protein [Pseudoalteromonas rubra]
MQLISVIIPFYSKNSGLLIKSVRSALNQSYTHLEVIVVDDCSPCKAEDELSSLHDPRLRVIRHATNSNGATARNTGVEAASGSVIAFLDYDDEWYPEKLNKQLSLLNEKGLNHVIYSQCKIIEPSGRTFTRPRRAISQHERVGDYLFVACEIIQTSGIMLSASLAQRVQFDDLKRHQDYQYCLALEQVGATFTLLDEVVYDFVQIPKLNDYLFSAMWLENYSSYLSDEATKGFKKIVILRTIIAHKKYIEALLYSVKNNITTSFFSIFLKKVVKGALPSVILEKL